MFSPRERDLERGWPGRIEDGRVIQLAAQTLQSYLSGGGLTREHAEYRLDEVVLRAPVLHPPSVRLFGEGDFAFANPAAILGPAEPVSLPEGVDEVVPRLRRTAIVGADGVVGACTLLVEWVAPGLAGAKRNDFALSLGPVALTPEELPGPDWRPLLELAGRGTRLLPGDLLAEPAGRELSPARAGDVVDAGLEPFGALRVPVETRGRAGFRNR